MRRATGPLHGDGGRGDRAGLGRRARYGLVTPGARQGPEATRQQHWEQSAGHRALGSRAPQGKARGAGRAGAARRPGQVLAWGTRRPSPGQGGARASALARGWATAARRFARAWTEGRCRAARSAADSAVTAQGSRQDPRSADASTPSSPPRPVVRTQLGLAASERMRRPKQEGLARAGTAQRTGRARAPRRAASRQERAPDSAGRTSNPSPTTERPELHGEWRTHGRSPRRRGQADGVMGEGARLASRGRADSGQPRPPRRRLWDAPWPRMPLQGRRLEWGAHPPPDFALSGETGSR